MKHNLLKSLIISVILLTGVSNAWALDIYLDFSSVDWPKDGAVIKLDPGTGSDVLGEKVTLLSDAVLYKFLVQEASGEMRFKRINPKNSSDTWNEAKIQYNSDYNAYKLKDWNTVIYGDYNINTVTPYNYIYFDNSITQWEYTNKYFVIGHDEPSKYSIAYTMYKIENTHLWYTHNLGNPWTDATYYSFFADYDAWGGNIWGISDISTADARTAPFTSHKNLNAGKYYLCCPTNKNNDQPFNISEYSSYTDLNYTQTIKAQVKYGETNPAYQQVISPATITATTHSFGSDYKKVDKTGSLTIDRGATDPAKLTQTVTAAYTSTVTLSYTDLHEAYEFMDWWDDTNGKIISTSATCTYVATKATTVYARFKAKGNYTRTVYLDARNWNNDQPRYAVYAYYGAESGQFEWIDMTVSCGSTNWYYTCEIPAKYSHVIFCRMNPENNNNTFDDDSRWGQTKDLLLLLDLDVNSCFTPNESPDNSINNKTYDGVWSTPPTFAVTLEGSSNGTFVVKYNNQEQSSSSDNITINIPICTQLTITDIQPNDGYDQTMVYKTSKYTEFETYELDNQGNRTYTYTVNSNVTIAEDFRTEAVNRIFVKVPYGDALNYWKDLRIMAMNGITQYMADDPTKYAKPMNIWHDINDDYILYFFDIPAGNHSFNLYPQEDNTASDTRWYEVLPKEGTRTVNQNCWLIDNEQKNKKATGRWISAKVTLDPCNIGTYGIKYNGEEYLNFATTSREIEMPYGSSIQIIDATPTSDHYEKNPRYETSVVKYTTDNIINSASEIKKQNGIIEIINVYGDNLKFAPNLVTKNTHRVFLHIPKDLKQIWGEVDNETNFNTIYLMDYLSSWRIALPTNPNPNFPYGRLEKMSALETFAADEDEYYYIDIPEGYHTFVFERKHKDALVQYGQPWIKSIILHYGIPTDENNNCFTIIDETGDENRQKGTWGPLPTCTITLGYPDIGRFGIIVNGETIYASNQNKRDTYITVPYGTEVQLLKGEPGDAAYTTNLVKEINGQKEYIIFGKSENQRTFTITSNVKFDDIFATKPNQTVFIAVPKNHSNLGKWYTCSNADHKFGHDVYVWQTKFPYDYQQDGQDKQTMQKKVAKIETNDYTYYQYTLDDHVYELNFQFKSIDANGTWDRQAAHAGTISSKCPPISTKNCFYLDGGINKKDGNDNHENGYTGYWGTKPNVGEYRVLYAEKELIKTHEKGETEDWETAFRTVYEHPSDIIKQTPGTASKNTVSLHITTTQERDGKKVHPMVILQQFQLIEGNTYDWVNLQAHTVLRLKATGNMGMLPGRKKAFGDLPFYDDGIEVIKNDTQYEDCTDDKGNSYKGSGVWNFVVNQASDGSVELDLSQTKRYQGEYYIRTNNAPGYWENYKRPEHEITYSSYAEQHSGFSHYYCKWIDRSKADSDVSFIIANDYATNLSDPSYLFVDQHITNERIPEDVNIRWAWEHMTNKVSRAYIRGTWDTNEPPARIENIVVDYTPLEGADPEQKLLYDSGDWIYSINLENMKVGSKLNTLTAQYPSDGYTQTFAENINMLVGEYVDERSYIVRILYDFKIDKTLVALVPNANEATVGIDVLIERIDQGPATQVVAQVDSKKNNNEGSTVYGAFTFTQPHLTNTGLSEQEKLTYWFSFPFDVLLSDVYGFGEVGKYWMIKEYDGESRAKVGLTEDNTFWKFITKKSTVLQANKGYVLTLNKRLMNEDDVVYTNTDSICLYFPSQNLVTSIDNGFTVEEDQVIEIPQWTGETAKKEWNWNLIGIPSYANKQEKITADHLYYFFDYRHSNDTYEVMYLGDHTFKSTFAYMVQFAGNINWHTFKTTPAQLAAQKDASAEINHVMRLELLRNNQREDKTYIQLTENENATEQFDMNFDLTKMANAKANLYSLIGNHQLAANVLPLQTTIVPLGVIIKTVGEYTFSMPDGTAGITAELIDYQTNTRTNLLLDNYTVTLPAGTNNSRFALSLQPDKTVTSVDNIGNEATGDKVKKYLIDGKLYLQKDGVLYDAQGHAL